MKRMKISRRGPEDRLHPIWTGRFLQRHPASIWMQAAHPA